MQLVPGTELKQEFDKAVNDEVTWLSPLESEDYREYELREAPICNALGLTDPKSAFGFWPHRQPQWAGIAVSEKTGTLSLMIEEIPFEWAERLKRTIENKDVKIHSAGYIQDSLKWIEIKEQEIYLYIRVDTFEKMYMYRSKERIEEPLEEGNYIFDKNLEKINFINLKYKLLKNKMEVI